MPHKRFRYRDVGELRREIASLVRVTGFRTTVPGVFAAGDLVNGGTTAVQGIAEGMRAAAVISAELGKE